MKLTRREVLKGIGAVALVPVVGAAVNSIADEIPETAYAITENSDGSNSYTLIEPELSEPLGGFMYSDELAEYLRKELKTLSGIRI